MTTHHESIHGTTRGLEPWQFYGPTTRRGNAVYLHLTTWPYDGAIVRGIDARNATNATLLDTGERLPMRGELGHLRIDVPRDRPKSLLPVIRLELAEAS